MFHYTIAANADEEAYSLSIKCCPMWTPVDLAEVHICGLLWT